MEPIITLLEAAELVQAESRATLAFSVEAPRNGPALLIVANGVNSHIAQLNTDLISQDVRLKPGEKTAITVSARVHKLGEYDWSQVGVQIQTDGQQLPKRHPLPSRRFRVVPSLRQTIEITAYSICQYQEGTKIEVQLRNKSGELIHELLAQVENNEQILAGPLQIHEVAFMPGASRKFEAVVRGREIRFELSGTIQGQRVTTTEVLQVPENQPSGQADNQFRFLEPRAFTHDRISLTAESDSLEIFSRNGVYPVYGDKRRYVLKITPSDPRATSVRVYPAPGHVEVEAQAKTGREWPFMITVVANPKLTELLRIDYDVQVEGSPLRGEIYLSIRPWKWTIWMWAATAGGALTLKGAAALLAIISRGDFSFDEIVAEWHLMFQKRFWEWLQFLSIPVIRYAHLVIDYLWRKVVEE